MKQEIRLKIITSKNENVFASVVEEFINDEANIVAVPPTYSFLNGVYIAFIEHSISKEIENEK